MLRKVLCCAVNCATKEWCGRRLQAAEAELVQGQRIWSEACASGRQNSFCAGSRTCEFSAALAAVYFVSRVLRSALHTGSDSAAGDKAPALAGVLARCEECWHGASGM